MNSLRYRMLLPVIVAISVVAVSCRSGNAREKYAGPEVSANLPEQTSLAPHALTITDIASAISSDSTVDDQAVGITGEETDQYRRFRWLSDFATDQELIDLTNNKSGNVKAYAFWALCKRSNPNCKLILDRHLNDVTPFKYMSGCMGWKDYVNVFYLQCLSGNLCAKEIESYKKRISSSFAKEEWAVAENLDFLNPVRGNHPSAAMSSCH